MLFSKEKTHTKISSFEYKRYVASKLAVPTAIAILIFFPTYNYFLENYSVAAKESAALAAYLILTPILFKTYGLVVVGRFSLFVIYCCIFLLMYDLKADNYFTVWVFGYLLYALVLHGHVWGTILSGILFGYTILMMWHFLGQTTTVPEIIRYSGAALITLSIGFFYERSNFRTFKTVDELNTVLRTLTNIDDLTGLHNRRFFNEVFQNFLTPSRREKNISSFIILDVDFFKQYNDTYGHQKGDEALRIVAQELKRTIRRKDDYCFRLGGEEFGILFSSAHKSDAYRLADEIVKNIQALKIEHTASRITNFLTISGGLVTKNNTRVLDYRQMYKIADEMLYKAKMNGRNQVMGKDLN